MQRKNHIKNKRNINYIQGGWFYHINGFFNFERKIKYFYSCEKHSKCNPISYPTIT